MLEWNGKPELLRKKKDETKEDYSDRIATALSSMMMPSLEASAIRSCQVTMVDAMARTVLALSNVHARTGHWPKEEELTGLGISLPLDIYGKRDDQVKYVSKKNGAQIYSAWHN